jgi:hypothetical protein
LGITLRPWREALVDYLSSPDAPRELLSDVHPSDTGPDERESVESRRSEVSR